MFIFSSLRRWDECALIFQNSGWCTEEPKADWHVLLAIIFERSAFLRQWLLCASLLFPPHPPKKLPKTGYREQENEVNCFNSPPHLYGVTFPMHPSINSQPSCVGVVVRVWVVGVCVWGRDNLNPRLFSCKLWAGRNKSLGWVFPSIRRGDWPAGSK